DPLAVHGLELAVRAPATIGMVTVEGLVPLEVAALVRDPRALALDLWGVVGEIDAQIADIVRGDAPGRDIPELRIDVAHPEVGRLHDMHVAVKNLESLLCHRAPLPFASLPAHAGAVNDPC